MHSRACVVGVTCGDVPCVSEYYYIRVCVTLLVWLVFVCVCLCSVCLQMITSCIRNVFKISIHREYFASILTASFVCSVMDFSMNQLTGSIPAGIGNMQYLK